MQSRNPISAIEWKQSDKSVHYMVDLPGTDAIVPMSYFYNKENIFGQFANVEKVDEGVYEAVRDPLGIGKMFYTQTNKGELQFSQQFTDLLQYSTSIYALPRGLHVRFGSSGERQLIKRLTPDTSLAVDFSDSDIRSIDGFHDSMQGKKFKDELSKRINRAFTLIKNLENKGFKVFIALSGGLDSSIIAHAARYHLKAPLACTLDLGRSEDAEKSSLITKEIGIEHVVFGTNEEEILEAVADSPVLCQDYRDFNVHCTALNLLLAKNIRAYADKHDINQNKMIILTGDTMNEFTCDYEEEVVDGEIYYRLPRVGKKMLQKTLISGLDTSDRELSPFKKYDLECIQPFAAVYDLYMALSESVLQLENVKQELNGHLVPESVLQLLPKSKLRAQVGNKESMGVLGLCHRKGIDEMFFLQKLLGTETASKGKVPITMGRYEVESFV